MGTDAPGVRDQHRRNGQGSAPVFKVLESLLWGNAKRLQYCRVLRSGPTSATVCDMEAMEVRDDAQCLLQPAKLSWTRPVRTLV